MNGLLILSQQIKINESVDFHSSDTEFVDVDNDKISFNELIQLTPTPSSISDDNIKDNNAPLSILSKLRPNHNHNTTDVDLENELLFVLSEQISLLPTTQKNPNTKNLTDIYLNPLTEELLFFVSKQANNLSKIQTFENLAFPNIFSAIQASFSDQTKLGEVFSLQNSKLKIEKQNNSIKNKQIIKETLALLSQFKDRVSISNPSPIVLDNFESSFLGLDKLNFMSKNTLFRSNNIGTHKNNYSSLNAPSFIKTDKLSLSSSSVFQPIDIVKHVIEQIDWDSKFDTTNKKLLESTSIDNIQRTNNQLATTNLENIDNTKNILSANNTAPSSNRYYLKEQLYSPLWGNDIGKNITSLLSNGVKKAELRLTPAELGTINIELHVSNKNLINLYVIAPNNTIKNLFESSIGNLKQSLSEEGFSLENSFVESNENSSSNSNESNAGYKRTLLHLADIESKITVEKPSVTSEKNSPPSISGVDTFV